MRTTRPRSDRPDRRPTRRRLATAAVLTLALAACGDEAVTDTEADVVEDAGDEELVDDDTADDTAEGEATVAVGSTDLGEVLVDGAGMTLYLFDPDEQGESTCDDDCAAAWPPLIDEDPVAGDGADDALLGTTERDDGSLQVTYDGWPVYLWASDQEPGDATGQGVEDVWWVLEADGTPIRDADDAADGDEEDGEDDGTGY